MPAYIENIADVLRQLISQGLSVVIFPEWQKEMEERYTSEMKKYSHFDVYYNCHRALPLIKSKLFLSSTATKHYYFSKTSKRFFYFHSVAGLSGFPEGGMDDYTDFLCATAQQLKELKMRFEGSGNQKTLHEAGYPKFDVICNRLVRGEGRPLHSKRVISTILVAPSYASDDVYSDVSMLPNIEILIRYLLDLGYRVIFRPHPVSLRRGGFVEKIELLKNFYASCENFSFDQSQDYFETYRCADVMITDVSGTSMMFKAAFLKPVIFYTPNLKGALEAYSSINQIGPITDQIQTVASLIDNSDITNSHEPPRIFGSGRSIEMFVEILKG
jgi:CDP-glycerol glycerophosphotransferase (TagB/SpsB family)